MFLTILLILILLYFLLSPVLRVWRQVRSFQKQYESSMGSKTGDAPPAESDEERKARRYREYTHAVGEDVEFEEITGSRDVDDPSVTNAPATPYQEEMISDAEYEEL